MNHMKKANNFSLEYVVSKLLFLIFCISFVLFSQGCGGGGGVYYPPQIAINSIDLQKIELAKTDIKNYNVAFFPIRYDQLDERKPYVKAGYKLFGKDGYLLEVKFENNDYYLYNSKNVVFIKGKGIMHGSVDIIQKSDMKKILFLPTPRYVCEFASFPITMGDRNFLVVYVEQQATSHSSTLFIIDSQFKIVYQEHLLGAEEIGYTHSDKYGNCIIVKTETFWFPNGHDTSSKEAYKASMVYVNDEWLYYLPKETKQ